MKDSKWQNEFETFLRSEEITPSVKTSKRIIDLARKHLQPSLPFVSLKYCAFFLLSIFVSLSLCPQSGVSFLREDFPLFQQFLHQNIVLCGAYCAIMFFFTTHFLAFILLNRYEKKVFSQRLTYLPGFLLALSFGVFMMMSPGNMAGHFWNMTYVATWLITAGLLFFMWIRAFQDLPLKKAL